MHMGEYLGHDIPKLGFGLMRLPLFESGEIDMEKTNQMVDAFLAKGFTYVDTAFGYLGGRSEVAAGKAVVARHPRESFQLATKLPPWELKEPADMERVFKTQMERTGAGYFDYYLLHNLNSGNIDHMEKLGAWEFVKQKKAAGLVRHIGFSFHDTAERLDALLTQHPETEFVQLQINYADWEDDKVQSRLCYEVARRHGKPVIIMEPVKGGSLATLSGSAVEPLLAARPDDSVASWAMRYAGSMEGIITILSGMSTMEQVLDNCKTMQDFEPLDDTDRKTLDEVLRRLAMTPTIPCTTCNYCTEKCPQNIPIPSILGVENRRRVFTNPDKGQYAFVTKDKGRASDCIACGICEGRCPQHIEIISLLAEAVQTFE